MKVSGRYLISYMIILLTFFTAIIIVLKISDKKSSKNAELNTYLRTHNVVLHCSMDYSFSKAVKNDIIKHVNTLSNQDIRISIFDTLGYLLYDSKVEYETIHDSFANRKELIDAKQNGEGAHIRQSATTDDRYYYLAQKFDNYYIRSVLPFNNNIRNYFSLEKEVVYLIVIVYIVVLFGVVYYRILHLSTIRCLLNIASLAEKEEFIDINRVIGSNGLDGVANVIAELYNKNTETNKLLKIETEKLFQHLHVSNEGLAVFSSDKKPIIVNDLFIQYSRLISQKVLKKTEDILEIPEFISIIEFLNQNQNKALSDSQILKKSTKFESNKQVYILQCIIFTDSSFELSINEVSKKEVQSRITRLLTENIAHELKTPVTTIKGYLETIISTKSISSEQASHFIDKALSQSRRLEHLVEEISLLNKIESGYNFFSKEKISVAKIIKTVAKDTSFEMEKKNVIFQLFLPNNIDIKGNDSLIYSIFRNLIDNSLTYAGENITITIDCYNEDPNYFNFSYSDTGIGIEAEHFSHIFSRFYRIDKGRSRKTGGTGLGLAIVQNAILYHGGNILVQKYRNSGLEFLFTLAKE